MMALGHHGFSEPPFRKQDDDKDAGVLAARTRGQGRGDVLTTEERGQGQHGGVMAPPSRRVREMARTPEGKKGRNNLVQSCVCALDAHVCELFKEILLCAKQVPKNGDVFNKEGTVTKCSFLAENWCGTHVELVCN